MTDAGLLMDAIYKPQRHIYDATRKFYLLGRDELILELLPPSGGRVLEIGCGTARNLIRVARRYPDATCFGIDVSQAMLATARTSVARCRLSHRVQLAAADATDFDPQRLFRIAAFDRIFVSYALSMIPPWQHVLRHAVTLLAPGGSLHVVDFGDQAAMPAMFKQALHAWLRRFHVVPRAELPDAVLRLSEDYGLLGSVRSRFSGYAISAKLSRTG